MKILNRIILLIITLLFMFASLVLAIYSLGFSGINPLPTIIANFYGRWDYGLLFIIFFIAGAWVIYPFFSRKDDSGSTIISNSELGEVDITLEAIKNLVQGLVIEQEGIEEINSKIYAGESGINIHLKGKVKPATIIPELTENLQQLVKSYIEDTTGVSVAEVKILIKDVYENVENTKVE